MHISHRWIAISAFFPMSMASPSAVSDDGEGGNRTRDTTIFSRVLYQLSYLAAVGKASGGRGNPIRPVPAALESPAVQILSKYDPATIDDLTSRDEFFWLDLENPGEQVVAALGERFDFHRLALDDALKAGQRPKLQSYDDGRASFLGLLRTDGRTGRRHR